MEDWKTYKLKDVCSKIESGATPRGGKSSYLSEGISFIRSQNVLDFDFSTDGLAFISSHQANQLSNVTVETNDILLNITGDSVARVCKVPNSILPARVNQHVCILRTKPKKLSSNFLKYYLLNPKFKDYMLCLAHSGATRKALTKSMNEGFEICIPPIEEQKAIAKILSSFDDKIELNRKLNATLEEMARGVFKAWFVDFEPVHANAEDRPSTSASPEITKLFPAEFQESELGLIPKGWEVGNYSDLTNIRSGKGLKKSEYVENGKYPIIGANGEIGRSNDYLLNENLIVTGRVGTLGNVKIIQGKNWISDNVLISQPKRYLYFTYHILKSFNLKSLNRRSTQPLITQTELKKQKVILPKDEIIQLFEQSIELSFRKIFANKKESKTLEQIRDSLLPRLISGNISVGEIEKEVVDQVSKAGFDG